MDKEWAKVWAEIGKQIQDLPPNFSLPIQLLLRYCFEMGWKAAKKEG